MRFVEVKYKKDIKDYVKFVKGLYKDDKNYIDYTTPIIREVLGRKSVFARKITAYAYKIEDEKRCVGVVSYLIHEGYSNVLQIAFLEYKDQQGVLPEVVNKACELAKLHSIKELVVGLNGHVNYGFGLSDCQVHKPTLSGCYTKDYYRKDLEALGFCRLGLSTYEYPWQSRAFPMDEEKIVRLGKFFNFRYATKATFKEDIALYTKLNNICFTEHPHYFLRTEEEDSELFASLKYFMEEGSLIFAEYKGEPIGFLLWYPDWGELMRRGETLSAWTYLKTLIHRRRVKSFKIVEWGVVPKFHGRGVPIGMLHACYLKVKNKNYSRCKTSWIVDDNVNSSGFGVKWASVYETYGVYTMTMKEVEEAAS